MKINGNIVSCAGNFALRARCKVARGTSHSVLVASGAGNFALRARCKVARGTSHFVLVARLRGELRTSCSLQGCAGNFALRARCKWCGETSLNVQYGGIVSPYEMENSIQPHYPLENIY